MVGFLNIYILHPIKPLMGSKTFENNCRNQINAKSYAKNIKEYDV